MVTCVSDCSSRFSLFCLNCSAVWSGHLNVTVTVEFTRYLLAVFFCRSSYPYSEIQIWFADSFAGLLESSGKNPSSYPILESESHLLRGAEQTSPHFPYA